MVRTNLSGLDMEQSLRAIMDIRAQLAFLSMDRPRITRGLRGLEDGLAMFNRLGVRINLFACWQKQPGRRAAAKLLTRDEARRIAANIAKLPELLPKA